MKKRQFKALILLMLSSLLLVSSIGVQDAEAAGIYTEPGTTMATDNWAYPVKCHTIAKENGDTMIVYSVFNAKKQQRLVLDLINNKGQRTNYKKLSVPGKTWGGTVYQSPDGCNYITTGNSDNIAFFVMKYNADWNYSGTIWL